MRNVFRTWWASFRAWRCKHPDAKVMERVKSTPTEIHDDWKTNMITGESFMVEIECWDSRVRMGCPKCKAVWIETISEGREV